LKAISEIERMRNWGGENLPLLLGKDERIYLNVLYMAKGFSQYSHCVFEEERKL